MFGEEVLDGLSRGEVELGGVGLGLCEDGAECGEASGAGGGVGVEGDEESLGVGGVGRECTRLAESGEGCLSSGGVEGGGGAGLDQN